MFLSNTIEGKIKEANSRLVLVEIKKNGYEIVRIKPGGGTKSGKTLFTY